MTVDGGYASSEFWQVVKPQASTNLVTNPSFEIPSQWGGVWANSDWAFENSSPLAANGGVFGAWTLRIIATATNGNTYYLLPSMAAGTLLAVAVYIKSTSPLVKLQVQNGAGVLVGSPVFHPGDGLWHRLEVDTATIDTTTHLVLIRDTRTGGWDDIFIDGAQVETGVSRSSTYIDGDQDGCRWTGKAHLSTSTRDGRDGRGGEIVSLESLGLLVMQNLGIGAPPVDIKSQEPALADGELFQRQRNKPRVVTLVSLLIGDGGLTSLHTVRRGLMDVFRPDSRNGRGPIMLRYSASAVPKLLPAYYTGGLEMDGIEAADEKIPLRLTAPDPDFVGETEDSSAISGGGSLAVSKLAHRDANGVWSALGGGLTTGIVSTNILAAVKLPDGRLVVGGSFTDMGGVAACDNLAVWDGVAWSALGGATPNDMVYALHVSASGDLYIGGSFTDMGGVAAADYVAKYTLSTNTWSALASGMNGTVYELGEDLSNGYVWAAGGFTGLFSYFNGTAWTVGNTGLPGGFANASFAYQFGRMNLAADTFLGYWNGASWTLWHTQTPASGIYTLTAANGRLYANGNFTAIGGVSANRIAQSDGGSWTPLGTGAAANQVSTMGVDSRGTVYAAGNAWGSIGGIVPPDNIAMWNGSGWLPFPADPPDTGTHANDAYIVFVHPDDSVTVGWTSSSGTFGSTIATTGQTTVTNPGSSMAYPILTIDTTGLIYWMKNVTTGQTIVLNALSGAVNGRVTFDLRPGSKTVRSAGGANLLPYVLAGSDLATFGLVPGDNVIEVYTSGTTTATLRFRARYWAAD